MKKPLVERLNTFMETWIANPAAKLEFVKLIIECELVEGRQAWDVDTWANDQRDSLRRIGIR